MSLSKIEYGLIGLSVLYIYDHLLLYFSDNTNIAHFFIGGQGMMARIFFREMKIDFFSKLL